jgi:hypothetical protein
MGMQEALYGIGTLALLAVLIYGVMRGRRPRSAQPAADRATDRNFDKP